MGVVCGKLWWCVGEEGFGILGGVFFASVFYTLLDWCGFSSWGFCRVVNVLIAVGVLFDVCSV